MNIVHAVRSDGFAGVERHVASLAAAQAQQGHHVVVVGGSPAEMAATAGREVQLFSASTTWQVVERVARLRRAVPPDVVHAHMTAAEAGCALALGTSSTPLVATRHFARVRGRNRAMAIAADLVARRVRGQIAISGYVASQIRGASTVIHPGVEPQGDARGAASRDQVVLIAQRLEPEKDTESALRAFAESGLVREGWRLDIAGDGSVRSQLEAAAAALGIAQRVRFLGQRSDVSALMRESAILVAPCPIEGLGMTVLEAMAAGLPVVAAAAGGHLETVGLARRAALYEPGDIASEASLLAGLAADPEARDSYGAELQELQRAQFTLEHQARQTERFYRSFL